MVFAPRYSQVWFCCCCPVTKLCLTLCDPMDCSMPGSLSLIISWSLPKFTSIESVMSSNHLTLCRPLLLLPSIFPSTRVFSNELALHIRWPKYWSFSASASVLPKSIQGWFTLRLTGLIALLSKGLLRVFSRSTVQKYQFLKYTHIHNMTDVRAGQQRRLSTKKLMLSNSGSYEDSWESLGLQGDATSTS